MLLRADLSSIRAAEAQQHLLVMIQAIANFSFCLAAAKFWQVGCLGDGRSVCGRCSGRHLAKCFASSGNS